MYVSCFNIRTAPTVIPQSKNDASLARPLIMNRQNRVTEIPQSQNDASLARPLIMNRQNRVTEIPQPQNDASLTHLLIVKRQNKHIRIYKCTCTFRVSISEQIPTRFPFDSRVLHACFSFSTPTSSFPSQKSSTLVNSRPKATHTDHKR